MAPRLPVLRDALDSVAPALPAALVSGSCLVGLRALIGPFPAVSGWGLECHLGEPDRVDLAVRFTKDEGGAEALSRLAARRGWHGVGALSALWRDTGCDIGQIARFVWLELDADSQETAPPGVFVDIGAAAPRTWVEVAETIAGGPLPEGTVDCAASIHDALPPGASVRYIGVMPGRDPLALRIAVYGLSPNEILPFTTLAGWSGDEADVKRLLVASAPWAEHVVLHLDVASDVGPTLGVELHATRAGSWWQLLRVASGEARREAALAWPGTTESDTVGAIVRRINHLKVTHRPGTAAGVKIYLYCGHIGGRRTRHAQTPVLESATTRWRDEGKAT